MANATVKQLNTLAAALPGVIAKLDAELATAQKRMAQLKRDGLVYATEHWREGRYLYLVHPQHDGERKREYVGTDPKKIKAAQDAIARARDYDALAERARQIEATLYEGGQRLAHFGSGPLGRVRNRSDAV